MHRLETFRSECEKALTDLKSQNAEIRTNIQTHAIEKNSDKPMSSVLVQPIDYDRFYKEFEERFRGSREAIESRQKNYLVQLGGSPVNLRDKTILDFGCGRGEWLKILSEAEFQCVGVDASSSMSDEAKQNGLNVYCQDGLEFLMRQPVDQFGAITSFQVVEHMPFNSLMLFLDHAYRTICPGGLLILETPNPENIEVGSCRFYLDPSHIKPIPPLTLQFLVEYRGFKNVEIVRLDDRGQIVADDFSQSVDYFIKAFK